LSTDLPFKLYLDLGENEKDPGEFRDCVMLAEKLGFQHLWLGDHFMPWFHTASRSAYVWSLMGACFQATKEIKIGPYVTTPIGARYHPAIIAQASATLDNMYPGRFLLGVGAGEAMNETPFLDHWPPWQERMDRLVEGLTLMRKLWSSTSYFDFDGKFFKMKQVYLYTKPKSPLSVYFSAVGEKAANYAGRYGDHLVTLGLHNSLERCKEIIFPSFEKGARDAEKNVDRMEKMVSLFFTLQDKETFLSSPDRGWAGIIAKGSWNEPDPRKIQMMGSTVSDEEYLKSTYFCSSWDDVLDLIARFREAGTTSVALFSGANEEIIRTYAKEILPYFNQTQ
jgi:coenzyme F420-dependent glucose-6-phosphate dehydrogenase